MLPNFPEFKKLELSDRTDVERTTSKYPPYADFNFEIMWSWDINGTVELSLLNGNLVFFNKNIFDNRLACSYLGDNRVNETLDQLFHFCKEKGFGSLHLSLVPEVSLSEINFDKYFIEIDLSACDYVYDIDRLAYLTGAEYSQKRTRLNSFTRNYPNVSVEMLNLSNPHERDEVLSLTNLWESRKHETEHKHHASPDKEISAMHRFIQSGFSNVMSVGVYEEKRLIGYSIFSLRKDSYAISQFVKADTLYKGVYEYIMRESAILLNGLGYKFMNFQDDMGLPGLRQAKNSFRPVKFLRKYNIKQL